MKHVWACRSAVKHVQACLSTGEDRESPFHHCGSLVRLVQACLCAVMTCKAVLAKEEEL